MEDTKKVKDPKDIKVKDKGDGKYEIYHLVNMYDDKDNLVSVQAPLEDNVTEEEMEQRVADYIQMRDDLQYLYQEAATVLALIKGLKL